MIDTSVSKSLTGSAPLGLAIVTKYTLAPTRNYTESMVLYF